MSVDTYSKEYMHQCLVRHVLKIRAGRDGATKAREFLDGWARKHPGDTQLRDDVMRQWSLGSRGKDGDWRTAPAEK